MFSCSGWRSPLCPPPTAPVALTASEPVAEPTVTCCTLDGFCQELTELECEEVSLVSLAQDVEQPAAPTAPPLTIDTDMAYAVLADPDAFEVRVSSCSEPFLRSAEQGLALNCLLDLDGCGQTSTTAPSVASMAFPRRVSVQHILCALMKNAANLLSSQRSRWLHDAAGIRRLDGVLGCCVRTGQ
jgi:hypothetical protein